jgi:hypothetical protein
MKVKDMRLRILVRFVLNKVVDSRHVRECFHSKLTVESPAEGIKYLVFLLRTVPDYCQY